MDQAARDQREGPAMTFMVLAVLVPPALAALALRRLDVAGLAWTPYLDLTLVRPLVLVAALAVYARWRTTGEESSRRSTVALVTLGVPGLVLSGLVLAQPQDVPAGDDRPLLVLALVNVVGVVVALLDTPTRWRIGPMALGCAAGAGVTAVSVVALTQAGTLRFGPTAHVVLVAVSAVAISALAGALLKDGGGSGSAWWGIATGVVLMTTGRTVLTVLSEVRGPALVTASLGAVVLAGSALLLASRAVHASLREATHLYERLYDIEARDREQRARLHEIGSTVAGLVAASRLVSQEPSLSTHRRAALASMVQSESERLERIIRAEESARGPLALDDALRPLVLARRVRGIDVVTAPTGAWVDARADEVAEILGILMDNAAAHSGTDVVRIDVRRRDRVVEVLVSDEGRGLPEELRSRIFDWGVRGPGSNGQGIGLSEGRRLARRQGGYLVVEDRAGPGTTFVVGLPAASVVRVESSLPTRCG